MQKASTMSAFAPCAAPRATLFAASGPAICASRTSATPFFASQAFGAPVATRVAMPKAAVRMDVTVVVGDSEPIESAIRRFKKDVTKSGHLFELRRRRYFETNTEKRLRKAAASRRKARMARNMKNNRKNQQGGSNRSSSSNSTTPSKNLTTVSPITPGTTPPNPRI